MPVISPIRLFTSLYFHDKIVVPVEYDNVLSTKNSRYYILEKNGKKGLVYDGKIDNTIDISKINSYKKLVSAVGDSLNKYIIDYDVSNLEPSQNKNFLTTTPEKNKEEIREIFYAEQEIKGEKTSS
jgi:hypothetical protein